MESNTRYHARRAATETAAAARALTPAARERHLALAESFAAKAGLSLGDTAASVFLAQSQGMGATA